MKGRACRTRLYQMRLLIDFESKVRDSNESGRKFKSFAQPLRYLCSPNFEKLHFVPRMRLFWSMYATHGLVFRPRLAICLKYRRRLRTLEYVRNLRPWTHSLYPNLPRYIFIPKFWSFSASRYFELATFYALSVFTRPMLKSKLRTLHFLGKNTTITSKHIFLLCAVIWYYGPALWGTTGSKLNGMKNDDNHITQITHSQ